MTIKIEFPSDNKVLAAAIGAALSAYGLGHTMSEAAAATAVAADTVAPKLPKTVDELAAADVVASADSSPEPENANDTKTSADNQSSMTHGETQSTASTAEPTSYAFEQLWESAGGLDYSGHAIHEELGVPVDDKGYPLIDTYGVPHDASMCGKAAKPFYGSGKEKGKWKAKVGVDKEEYAAWHLAQLEALGKPVTDEPTNTPTQSASAAAFGAQTTETPPATNTAGTPADNFGTLMGWIAAKQTACALTGDQINEAYAACGTDVTQMMQDANARAAVYQTLLAMAG
ncbi:hypothetical protein NVP1009O_42 [Vibrio phage 1.009.O._10N.261.51.C9]|nr:hypothetical protein NVP1009O_42 [Vibrio phage 1.009.O._10N.261.51.C9]